MATGAIARPREQVREVMFLWEGRDKQGRVVKGEMRAGGESVVAASLRRRGIIASKIRKQSFSRGRRITEKDLALFTRQLSTMLRAGVPLMQSFDIVGRGHANPSMSRLINDIRMDVETGTSLNQAFRKYPMYFDALFCNLVAAGEQAGILETLLDRLALYKEKTLALKGKIKKALFYPTMIILVSIAITAIIMIFVIPSFKQVFASFGADLPAPTLFVMAMSDFFVKYWYVALLGAGGGFYFAYTAWKRSPKVQMLVDRLLLKPPVIGELITKASIARWSRTLSTTFAAGVPLVEALDSVGPASGNAVYKEATKLIQNEVNVGTSLAVAMQNSMTSIGEESGSLDSMLSKVADYYEREVDEAVDAMASLLEPLIMVVLGVVIGGIVVAIYLPIFKLGQVV
jgi:type IV pilus assembly protein PilC